MNHVKRVVMVLWDGFGSCFLHHTQQLPNVQRLLRRSIFYPHCQTVYPTVTNVAWTSMMTGAYPEKTHNLAYYWDRELNQARGLHRTYQLESIVESLARGGRSSGSVGMFILLNHGLKWAHEGGEGRLYVQPANDFAVRVDEAIRFLAGEHDYIPDFLTVYTSVLDGLAHSVGPDHPGILTLLLEMDRHLGRLLDYIEEGPDGGATAIILAADHGFSPAQISLRDVVTARLHDAGYNITWLSNGEQAPDNAELIGVGPGRTASLYFLERASATGTRPFSPAEREETVTLLEWIPGIARVLQQSDLVALRTDTRLGDIVLEADIPYAFWEKNSPSMRGTHSSQRELDVPLIVSIPGLPPAKLSGGRTIDIAPTIAALLNAPQPREAQGRSLLPELAHISAILDPKETRTQGC